MEAAPTAETLKVLLIEDDEDDFFIAREMFSEFRGQKVQLDWVKNFSAGLDAMARNQHDICLVDYRLGAQNGVELLRAALDRGCRAPVILLTGQGEHEIDLEAMKAGAADYLVKGRLDASLLERSIRYAIERRRAADSAASEQARLAAFGEDVGLALARRDPLDTILHRCATAMVHYLHATLARIWVCGSEDMALQLQASAGMAAESEALPYKQPKVAVDMALIAEGRPILINKVVGDKRIADQEWAKHEGIVAYAGYPLVLEDRLVGLMSVFSRNPLSDVILQEMASVANGIALCIERKRSVQAGLRKFHRPSRSIWKMTSFMFSTTDGGTSSIPPGRRSPGLRSRKRSAPTSPITSIPMTATCTRRTFAKWPSIGRAIAATRHATSLRTARSAGWRFTPNQRNVPSSAR